ncbi:MAG TPA: GHMP kinase [Actinomycetota bacterium]|nr:GHMP kinase [Actinomycetota bacterium]
MTAVRASAPLRISFAGGGTDVPPYPSTHGGAVLSATISRCATAHVQVRSDGAYHVDSLDLMARAAFTAREDLAFNGHLDLVKAVLRGLDPGGGLDLVLATDAPPGSGLGSSSALVVAMLAAVGATAGRSWSPAELAWRAYEVERIDLKIQGGMQDQYAAAFGGLNFIEFHGDDDVEVRPLEVRSSTVEELERSLLLAWSGQGRTDGGILRRQIDGVLGGSARSLGSLGAMKALAEAMRDALLAGDLATFAEGLHEGWEQKRRLATGIATPRLEELYEVGRAAGAAGGKVLGAGGGGFLVFCGPPAHGDRVAAALEAAGAPCSPVAFDPRGVRL